MACHIANNLMLGTLCGKRLNELPEFDSYVEELSRRVMEMPTCVECRKAYHKKALERLEAYPDER